MRIARIESRAWLRQEIEKLEVHAYCVYIYTYTLCVNIYYSVCVCVCVCMCQEPGVCVEPGDHPKM